jgi:hypothetical protein
MPRSFPRALDNDPSPAESAPQILRPAVAAARDRWPAGRRRRLPRRRTSGRPQARTRDRHRGCSAWRWRRSPAPGCRQARRDGRRTRAPTRAAHGEVDVRDGARKPGVVEHRGEVEQLTIERDPASCGDGGCPGVRAMGVVAQHRCEEVVDGLRASRASDESGGARRAGSTVARRPECRRRAIANRPARMPSSPRSSGVASVTHSPVVSTPPVRSVQPIDPSG